MRRQLEEENRRFREELNIIFNNNNYNYNNLIETKIKFNKLKEENKTCVICYEDFKDNDDAIFLPCFHFFHTKCIKKWLKNKNFCPLCKINVKNNLAPPIGGILSGQNEYNPQNQQHGGGGSQQNHQQQGVQGIPAEEPTKPELPIMPAQPLIAQKPQFNPREVRQEGNYPQQGNLGFQGQQNGGNQFAPQGGFPGFGPYEGFGPWSFQ